MSRPWQHPKSGIYWLRKRVPKDLRGALGKLEEKRSLKTRDPNEAKALHAEALVALEAEWARARANRAVAATESNSAETLQPKSLTEREAHERARWLYSQWLWKHRDFPSRQIFWRTGLFEHLWANPPIGQPAPECGISVIDALKIADMRRKCFDEADLLAAVHDWVLDEPSRERLAKALGNSLQQASLTLGRQAAGEQVEPTPQGHAEVAFDSLFSGWAAERKPAPKTVYEWRRVFDQFAAHLGHTDASKVRTEDVIAWKDALVAAGRHPKTIRDAKIAPIRTVFRWAVDNRRLPTNPAAGVTISVRWRSGEDPRGFSDDEAKVILSSAEKQTNPVLRWVPWVCAHTGARVDEVCQLRKEDVAQIDGIWSIKFDADAGRKKTRGSERTVPIHPALLANGFVDFVRLRPEGVLFPELPLDRFGKRGGNGTKVIGRWMKSLGIYGKRIQPNHSWRHRMRTLGRRYGLALDLANAITGHAGRTGGDHYGETQLLPAMLRELSKIPAI